MFRDWPSLWQQLKAELAIPLQAGLCHAEGVAPPGSLLMLPTEVKQCCFQNLEVRAKPGTDLSWQLQQERTLCAKQRISPAPAPALPTLTSDSMHNLKITPRTALALYLLVPHTCLHPGVRCAPVNQ